MLSDVMTNAGPVAPSSFYDDECWSRGPKQNIKRKPFYLKMTMFFVGGGGVQFPGKCFVFKVICGEISLFDSS
jgi:hypothetical protein